jgi:predicted nucleic acid-binding protein
MENNSEVIFDNSFLIEIYNNKTNNEQYKLLLEEFKKDKIKVCIPTPTLSEFLCNFKNKQEILLQLDKISAFEVIPFDKRIALECSVLLHNFDKKEKVASWHKVKIDFQIIATAKAKNINNLFKRY